MTTLPYLGIATGERTRPAASRAQAGGGRTDDARAGGAQASDPRADGARVGGGRTGGSHPDSARASAAPARGARAGGGRADSAELIGSPSSAAERTEPSDEAPRPYDVRTLRILALLEERTDETRALTSTDIKNLLAHPDDPDVPPIQTTNSSVRHSIGALRAVGLAIQASNHTGFALVKRALPTSDMELVLHTVWTSAGLGAAQRTRLMGELLPLAPPALRERFEGLVAGEEVADPEPATEHIVAEEAEHLVRRAIEHELPLTFELMLAAPAPVAPAPVAPAPVAPDSAATAAAAGPDAAATRRFRLIPQELFVAHGTTFVRGRAEPQDAPAAEHAPLPSGLDTHRTFRLDRMANISLRDEDGTLHVANAGASANTAATAGSGPSPAASVSPATAADPHPATPPPPIVNNQ